MFRGVGSIFKHVETICAHQVIYDSQRMSYINKITNSSTILNVHASHELTIYLHRFLEINVASQNVQDQLQLR